MKLIVAAEKEFSRREETAIKKGISHQIFTRVDAGENGGLKRISKTSSLSTLSFFSFPSTLSSVLSAGSELRNDNRRSELCGSRGLNGRIN